MFYGTQGTTCNHVFIFRGLLLLDFTTARRSSPTQLPMDNESLAALLSSKAGIHLQTKVSAVKQKEASGLQADAGQPEQAHKLCALRALSPHMAVSAVQVGNLHA
jgi:hypothetical protein